MAGPLFVSILTALTMGIPVIAAVASLVGCFFGLGGWGIVFAFVFMGFAKVLPMALVGLLTSRFLSFTHLACLFVGVVFNFFVRFTLSDYPKENPSWQGFAALAAPTLLIWLVYFGVVIVARGKKK